MKVCLLHVVGVGVCCLLGRPSCLDGPALLGILLHHAKEEVQVHRNLFAEVVDLLFFLKAPLRCPRCLWGPGGVDVVGPLLQKERRHAEWSSKPPFRNHASGGTGGNLNGDG